MTAIVVNTLNGAVTEYDWGFQSLTPTHAGAGASGLLTFGGELDGAAQITGVIRTGKTLLDSSKKKAVEDVYFGLQGSGEGVCLMEGASESYEFPVELRSSGVSRAVPGKGIAENYMSFGYRNVAGADFRLDRIDAEVVQSKQRRT
jgi:hypothetical protein